MSWPNSYAADVRFNPWPIKYVLPAVKWFPIYWPNQEWMVTPLSPAFDEFGNRVAPRPPDGAILHWWHLPKDQWPIQAPWEPKVFGAWPASQISMRDDLVNHPPFGVIKLKMPGERDRSENEIPLTHWKMHMRPDMYQVIHHMKIMTQRNALGETKFYLINENWERAEYDAKLYRAALKEYRNEKFRQMLAAEIAKTKGKPQPSKDLFV
jgi:hypothetical protein